MRNVLYWVLLVVTSVLTLGCVGTGNNLVVKEEVVNLYDGGEINIADLPKSIAILPLTHNINQNGQASIVRQMLVNNLTALGYELPNLQQVDKRLENANITLDQLATMTGSIANLLGVDAVMLGKLTNTSENSLGVDLQLHNGTGKKLWHLINTQTITGAPVYSEQLSVLVNRPQAKVSTNLFLATEQLGRYINQKIPKYLTSSPTGPVIELVVFDSKKTILKAGDSVNIAIKGETGSRASAMIEGIEPVALTESAPGEYFGVLTIGDNQTAINALVQGILNSPNGVMSKRNAYGVVNVDSQRPQPISELMVLSNDSKGVISWKESACDDVINYQVTLQGEGEQTIVKHTSETELHLSGLANFVDYTVNVVALDGAQNQSQGVLGQLKPVADVSMAHAATLTQFPKRLRQSSVLTKKNSPYLLNHELVISESAVLFVEPGVEITTTADGQIVVKGELAIFGTTKRPVVITSNASKLYKPFMVLDSDLPSTLQGVKIVGMGVAIDIKQGDHLIENCQLLANSLSAIKISGDATPILKSNTIADNKASGVVISAQAKPIFIDNRFNNNLPFHIQSSSSHQIDARNNHWQPQASKISVLGDILY